MNKYIVLGNKIKKIRRLPFLSKGNKADLFKLVAKLGLEVSFDNKVVQLQDEKRQNSCYIRKIQSFLKVF